MKNLMKIFALVLCMAFVFPAALAQETGYRLNGPTEQAFANAFASGKLVTGEITLDLDLDAQALGVSAEEAAMVASVLDVLRQSTITVGAGMNGNSLRILLAGDVADAAGANPVSGDFSLLARGFEICGSEIRRAVEQITVAGNFYQLLRDVTAVGDDLLFEGSPVGCPSVAVRLLNIAGE